MKLIVKAIMRLVVVSLFVFQFALHVVAQDQPLTRKDVEEIAEIVTKVAVRKELNAKYRCEVGQYYSDATDLCEECEKLCTPEDNAAACNIDCPGTYAEIYLIAPLRTSVVQLAETVTTLNGSLVVFKKSYTERVEHFETTLSKLQDKIYVQTVLISVLTAILVLSAVVTVAYILRKKSSPRPRFPPISLQVQTAPDVEAVPDTEDGESPDLDPHPIQEQDKLNHVPPADTTQGERYEQGPSGSADETSPLHTGPLVRC